MSFTTSEKPVQLHTLEKGTRFVKSFRGLPCSKIYRLGVSYPYASFSFFLCENIDTFNSELFGHSHLVFPVSYPEKYPSFFDLTLSESLSFNSQSFIFLENYFESLPVAYLESVDGIDFVVQYRRFLALYLKSLQSKIDSVHVKVESLRTRFHGM
ncbi:hypothetical protein PL373_14370 [Tenacibaculum maritimum]|nr:hypothetical protein [Tenacibaculum maritimum]MDB0599645.1 hypothetical protein [Tenacibaculum maritimum]MDB0599889.1 hypothetical protein [Tenacibaculum maritimum]MDB0601749.1 hypothetical protein [Tenacibaculum maritimum]MDB0602303.1 hypothetical protein [Tenacibaculum maritimum]MDB0611035.1 hypothetical protein [Tenacibaculum maritimum]